MSLSWTTFLRTSHRLASTEQKLVPWTKFPAEVRPTQGLLNPIPEGDLSIDQ